MVNLTNSMPSKLSPEGIAQFQLVVANEFFEASFFSSLFYDVTNDVTGYQYDKRDQLVTIPHYILAVSTSS